MTNPNPVVIQFSRRSRTTGKIRTGYVQYVSVVTHAPVMSGRKTALCQDRSHLSTLAANMETYADRHANVVPGSVRMLAANAADIARAEAIHAAWARAYPQTR